MGFNSAFKGLIEADFLMFKQQVHIEATGLTRS